MNKIIHFILLVALFTASGAVRANKYVFCRGEIMHVWVAGSGSMNIRASWMNNHTQVCRIGSSWKGVSSEVCNAWLSIAQAAQVSQQSVTVRYNSDDIASCSEIPAYGSSPSPNYIMLRND